VDDPVAWLFPGYKIGVLANRGPMKAFKEWKATADYLSAKKRASLSTFLSNTITPPVDKGKKDTLRFDQLGDVRRAEQALRGPGHCHTDQQVQESADGQIRIADLVRHDSPVENLSDLKGKSFACASRSLSAVG